MYNIFKQAYDENTLSQLNTFEWDRRLGKGREEVEDNEPGR